MYHIACLLLTFLRNDGTVAEWGYNSWQSVPADLENVIAIDCNSNGFNALNTNGDVICWGYDQMEHL